MGANVKGERAKHWKWLGTVRVMRLVIMPELV
jgi:hypothetical protein